MAITTLENVKNILQIDDDSKDTLIEKLIPLVESDFLGIRNAPFDTDDEGKTIYPDGAELTAIQMIAYHLNTIQQIGIASESLAEHSITFAQGKGYPDAITKKITRYINYL